MRLLNMPSFTGYHEEAASDDGVGGAAGVSADPTSSDIETVITDPAVNNPDVGPSWQWSESVPGDGDAPDWLKGDKYKTVEAQAKAYTDLEGKFGSFTGAPEEYEVNISEELKCLGYSVDADDPVVQEFSKWAKESNLNQDGYDGLIQLKGMMDAAQYQADQEAVADELKRLGPQGQARIDNINSWASANLPTDMIQGFQGMAVSEKAIEALEAVIGKTRNAPISPEVLAPQASMSIDDLKTMQFARDERGNRKMQDPEYRARFQKLSHEIHGAGPARQTII